MDSGNGSPPVPGIGASGRCADTALGPAPDTTLRGGFVGNDNACGDAPVGESIRKGAAAGTIWRTAGEASLVG